jgi:hypothetical protein
MRLPVSFISLRFERVDHLGAYRIPPETGILIPSVFAKHDPNTKTSGRAKSFCGNSNYFNNRNLKEAKAPEKATATEIHSRRQSPLR